MILGTVRNFSFNFGDSYAIFSSNSSGLGGICKYMNFHGYHDIRVLDGKDRLVLLTGCSYWIYLSLYCIILQRKNNCLLFIEGKVGGSSLCCFWLLQSTSIMMFSVPFVGKVVSSICCYCYL